MSSPTVSVLDAILALLGIAPLNLLIKAFFRRRNRRREAEVAKAVDDALKKGE